MILKYLEIYKINKKGEGSERKKNYKMEKKLTNIFPKVFKTRFQI